MRSIINVVRYLASVRSYLVGSEVLAILGSIASIRAIEVDKQYLDGASLSYETTERLQNFERIDKLLNAYELRRV
ncbi:MAG TPA: hypothetical protein VFG55_06620 [Rhodanobacteraceae bacterium]|nr:hypothetical protein [Rhodanobacteraceae bacterium]